MFLKNKMVITINVLKISKLLPEAQQYILGPRPRLNDCSDPRRSARAPAEHGCPAGREDPRRASVPGPRHERPSDTAAPDLPSHRLTGNRGRVRLPSLRRQRLRRTSAPSSSLTRSDARNFTGRSVRLSKCHRCSTTPGLRGADLHRRPPPGSPPGARRAPAPASRTPRRARNRWAGPGVCSAPLPPHPGQVPGQGARPSPGGAGEARPLQLGESGSRARLLPDEPGGPAARDAKPHRPRGGGGRLQGGSAARSEGSAGAETWRLRHDSSYCFTLSPRASLRFFLAASSSLTKVAIAPHVSARPQTALHSDQQPKNQFRESLGAGGSGGSVCPAPSRSEDVYLVFGSARLPEEKVSRQIHSFLRPPAPAPSSHMIRVLWPSRAQLKPVAQLGCSDACRAGAAELLQSDPRGKLNSARSFHQDEHLPPHIRK